jgi:hypothetical protein
LNIAVDLDGTIAEWSGTGTDVGEWIEGARDALVSLRTSGHAVIVHSCRATWDAGGSWMGIARFLKTGEFTPYAVTARDLGEGQITIWQRIYERDGVLSFGLEPPVTDRQLDTMSIGIWVGRGKPIAHAYIDDRAVAYRPGDWPKIAEFFCER